MLRPEVINLIVTLEKRFPEGSEINGTVSSANEYALYVKLDDFDIDGFLHANDLSFVNKPEEALDWFLRTKMDMLVMENIIIER